MKHIHTFESFLYESKDEVIFSIDDDKLDQLLHAKFSKEIDYEDVKGDSYYALPKKAFDRFIDLADSSGFNEGDEVSVEKVTTPAERKALKNAFENSITGVDKISFKRDGTILAKKGYFYRHGLSPEKMAETLKNSLNAEGIEIEVIDKYDDWNAWPKDSNMVVVFKLK